MIYDVLHFLKTRLESFISEGRGNGEPLLVLSSPWSSNDSNQKSTFLNSISLINIEEERFFKTQREPVIQNKNGYFKKEPDLKLNLYILISAYNKNYEDGLKFISKVVSFFQQQSVFYHDSDDILSNKDLPGNISKLVVELYTASFEEQNLIWSALSVGYVPSVIYKLRMVVIENEDKREFMPIKEIKANY